MEMPRAEVLTILDFYLFPLRPGTLRLAEQRGARPRWDTRTTLGLAEPRTACYWGFRVLAALALCIAHTHGHCWA
jgi:hypothetical protein